jgi:hypothetical protein
MTSMAATAFGTIVQAISLAGRLSEISKKIGDAEFSALLADLQLELSEAKARIATLVDENTDLRARVQAFEAKGQIADGMTFDGVAYRKAGDMSAYCPTCWDANERLIRLNAVPARMSRLAKYVCPSCHAPFGLGA